MRLRAYIPEVSAAAQGGGRVVWGDRDREASCVNDRETYWIRFGTTSLYDRERHDTYTQRGHINI